MTTSGLIRLQRVTKGKQSIARSLRQQMTDAEQIIWERLRNNKLGVKFRRQQVIQGYIADFYCEDAKLVIEIDGLVHEMNDQKSKDEFRSKVFEDLGLQEIRFSNSQVENEIEKVIEVVKTCIS